MSPIAPPPVPIFIYRWIIILLGVLLIAVSVRDWLTQGAPWDFLALMLVTILVALKVSIKLTRYNGSITVADTFIFLGLMLWGTPVAVLIAAAESAASTSKVSRRIQTYLFNASVSVISIWTTGWMLKSFFAEPAQLGSVLSDGSFVLAVASMSLTHYLVQMSLIAVMQALKMSFEDWRMWMRQYYLWSCITFFVAAITAGIVVKFVGSLTVASVLIIAPVIFFVYFTYQTYLKNLDALQETEARFRSSFDYANVGMALLSPDGFWLQINQSLSGLLGRSQSEIVRLRYSDVLHLDDAPRIKELLAALLRGEMPTFQHEIRLICSDGEIVTAVLSASTARDAQNEVRYIIFQTQDITLRKKAEEQLHYDASHDVLTGLHNRASYTVCLKNALRRSKHKKAAGIAVLFLDLDGFKMVNDSLGHAAGDELLKATAGRLLECVRAIDTVARLGGDEFTILLEDLENVAQAVRVAERIEEKLSEPFEIDGQEIFISTSIGVATTEIAYEDAGEMLRDADAAMYQAKARGKSCFVLFDNEMHSNVSRQLRLANDLRRAGERGEFVLHYQVMQRLETDQICGFEALIRWQHPVYGLLPPSEFITLAEENGLTSEIDRWALETACRQMRRWQNQNLAYADLMMSVNVSTKQFARTGLFEYVQKVLRETKLAPSCLQLEVTESAMVQNLKNTASILTELHDFGVSIALDDFGTGYSSLSYLHELPITTLKIDRSFISRLNDDNEGAAIVQAIIVLGQNLKIKVIAEGIENFNQLDDLRKMGCEYGQGFLYSRPVAAPEAIKLLNASHSQIKISNRTRPQLRLVSGA